MLYGITYNSVADLLEAGDAPDNGRNDLQQGMPDDQTDEPVLTKREAVEDALAGRPPRR